MSGYTSPDKYREDAHYRFNSARGIQIASRSAPTNVTDGSIVDGRFWGDPDLTFSLIPTSVSTPQEAAKISAVNFVVSIIAEAVGSVDIDVTDMAGNPVEDSFADMIAYGPNPLQTSAEFWSSMAFAAALRNEAFAEPVIGSDGEMQMWLLDPLRTVSLWGERGMAVNYQPWNAPARQLGPGELFWFTGLSDATLRPLCPWRMAKGSMDFALALEMQGRSFFQNNARLSGILSTEQEFKTEETVERLKKGVREWRSGQTPVLEKGLKYTQVSSTNVDAQLAELIKQRTVEMGRYWRVPRSMYGEDGADVKNDEQETRAFVRHALRPWCRRIEQAIPKRLMTPSQRRSLKVRFNLDSILRGDSATQWRNAVLARTSSILSIDDIRTGWFNMQPLNTDWSKDPRTPLNSNHAGDTLTGGETSPQDRTGTTNG